MHEIYCTKLPIPINDVYNFKPVIFSTKRVPSAFLGKAKVSHNITCVDLEELTLLLHQVRKQNTLSTTYVGKKRQ